MGVEAARGQKRRIEQGRVAEEEEEEEEEKEKKVRESFSYFRN